MRQPTSRRQIKHLLKVLKDLQEDDFPITAPILLSAKHLLRHKRSRHCSIVDVAEDPALAPSFSTNRDQLPEYIISQLETQKLTPKGSQEIAVNPLLAFILDALPNRLDTCRRYPALFTWYSKSTHRFYLIAAHLIFEMPSLSYSIQELLNLRGNQGSNQLFSVAESNRDIAAIVDSANLKKPLVRHKELSSGSDEVVYKANLRRRATREGRREVVAQASVTQESVTQAPATHAPASQVSAPQVPVSKTPVTAESSHEVTDPNLPTVWKYRGRSEDEADRPEPISAPMGEFAQKSEGFKRFYKAVVSPTHVRVTAGGRIVPNTRGPASPTSKRSKESSVVDPGERTSHAKPTRPAFGMAPGQPIPAIMPQVMPGFRPGVPQVYPGFPFMPMAFGPQMTPGFAFPPGMSASASVAGDGTLKENQNSKTVESQPDNMAGTEKHEKIKLSPPEHFDSTRPFWFNGQYMYPWQMGPMPHQVASPFMPFPMMGMPPGLAGSFPGQMMPTPAPLGQQQTQPQPLSNPPSMVNAHVEPRKTSAAPHVSSIKPSEITKKQIASFKANLKYLEDQLQYNRHQIDEKDMEAKIKATKDHIDRFNGVLKAQLQFEETAFPDEVGETTDVADRPEESVPSSKPSNPESAEAQSVAKLGPSRAPSEARKALRPRYPQLTIGESGQVNYDFSPDAEDSGNPLTLPNGAALAPVFRPRAQAASWGEGEGQEREARSGKPISASMDEQRASSRSLKTSSSSDAPSSIKEPKYSVPYLLGSLPHGVDPRTALDTDYTYVRPLNDDEVRARFLYWGKAPQTARRGLPKYDGRHFYPASPVKSPEDDSDPFQECVALRHSSSFHTQVGDDQIADHQTAEDQEDPINDSVSMSSYGRRSDKSSRLLQAMVKKGASSSYVSPATAQGYLPQYQKGHAAASLSPSINKNTTSPYRDASPSKMSLSSDGGAALSPVRDARGENCPPLTGAEERFKRLVIGEHAHRSMMK